MRNISFDGTPVQFEAPSRYLALIDPLALDALRADIAALAGASLEARIAALARMPGFLSVGVQPVPPGDGCLFRLTLDDFEHVGEMTGPDVVDIDTGAMVVADLGCLPAIASVLDFDRYDWLLAAPTGDDSRERELTAEIGGPCFALITGDADRAFAGDGAYRLRPGRPERVTAAPR